VEPQPLVRLGLRGALDESYDVEEIESRCEAVDRVRDVGDVDVAVIDVRSPAHDDDELSGGEAIRELRKAEPALGIVAHGDRPERHLATEALSAGASAYVSMRAGADQLRRAVSVALEQEGPFVDPAVPPPGSRGKLTRRQRQILQMLADGESITLAAQRLGLSEQTVKTHTKNMLARLAARNRAHAVAIALRESLIE
jgi:DNA-binding NarL/FixJ family response regulator